MPKPRHHTRYSADARWTAAEARAALRAADEAGLSLCAFAKRAGLEPQRLYWWRRRLAAEAAEVPPTFIELKPSRPGALIEVVLRSGRVLRVPESIDPAAIQRLVAVLE